MASEADRLGAQRVLVIASTRDTTRVNALLAPLGERVVGTFSKVREHAPLATAEAARAAARTADADLLLAIGAVRPSGRPRPSP